MDFSDFFERNYLFIFSPFRNTLVFSDVYSDGHGQALGEGIVQYDTWGIILQ